MADQIQKELSDIIRTELKDPRVGLITLTDAEVSQDRSHAKVYFTSMGEGDSAQQAAAVLERAAGFLRGQLARRMLTRTVPQLHFVYDTSVERGMRLTHLIDEAVADDKDRSGHDES